MYILCPSYAVRPLVSLPAVSPPSSVSSVKLYFGMALQVCGCSWLSPTAPVSCNYDQSTRCGPPCQVSSRTFGGLTALAPSARIAVRPFQAARCQVVVRAADRFRLDNLGPEPGSRREEKRKGRGYGAGQVS
jgi:hypothetical protein